MRTQTDRLRDYLRDHPGASSLEITLDLAIVNVTGRISDLRAKGVEVICYRRQDGRDGYRINEPPAQMTWSSIVLAAEEFETTLAAVNEKLKR